MKKLCQYRNCAVLVSCFRPRDDLAGRRFNAVGESGDLD